MIKADSIKIVCRVSVHIMVFIPPRNVYSQIKRIVTSTVTKKGAPQDSKTLRCKTLATIYNLNDAPIVREIIKNIDPVL